MRTSVDNIDGSKLRTPYYRYRLDILKKAIDALNDSNVLKAKIHYAIKANANPALLEVISKAGYGADCVSGNEITWALAHGFSAETLVFSGAGKTDKELTIAVEEHIGIVNCESVEEIKVLNGLCHQLNRFTGICLRINPDIDPHTHQHITTGTASSKFGIPEDDLDLALREVKRSEHLNFLGIHMHIGSQITDMAVFVRLADKANAINRRIRYLGLHPERLNLGGGLGVDYDDPFGRPVADFKSWFRSLRNLELTEDMCLDLEPGRSLVAHCGDLVTQVLYTKKNGGYNFVIVDAGMNNLIRPALYDSKHLIENITKKGEAATQSYQIAGPICEQSDTFAKSAILPSTERGDMIIIHTTGAYGESMSSNYNMRDNTGVSIVNE